MRSKWDYSFLNINSVKKTSPEQFQNQDWKELSSAFPGSPQGCIHNLGAGTRIRYIGLTDFGLLLLLIQNFLCLKDQAQSEIQREAVHYSFHHLFMLTNKKNLWLDLDPFFVH